MKMDFALRGDPRQNHMLARDRHAYASAYLFNAVMMFKAASLVTERESSNLARVVVDQLTVQLGLPMSSCAKILKVTRPTVYSWQSQKQTPQAAQLARLGEVHKSAQIIANHLRENPALDLKAMLPDGNSVMTILASEIIDLSALSRALKMLCDSPIRYLADIPDEVLEEEGHVNQALLQYLETATK
jgi:hypothetical protein